MSRPISAGINGVDAIRDIASAVRETEQDEDFQHALYHLAQNQGPDADARPLLKVWLQDNQPEKLQDLEIGTNNADDAQTNFAPPVSPEVTNKETGVIPSHPNMDNITMEDSLDFIRTLAGLKK